MAQPTGPSRHRPTPPQSPRRRGEDECSLPACGEGRGGVPHEATRNEISIPQPLSHVGEDEQARMVDVSEKPPTQRVARAEATVFLGEELARLVAERRGLGKGPVLETARLAGIQAAKHTWELIPLCHPIPLDHVEVELSLDEKTVRIQATARATARTGVEMEALTAAAVAALTVYDMVKAHGRDVEIGRLRLLEKSGGRSGLWKRGSDEYEGHPSGDLPV